jgi:mono/diheme cytochrome c family protein
MTRYLALALGAALVAAVPVVASSPSQQFTAGRAAFAENCANCHGENGRGGPGYANPIWGPGAQLTKYRTAAGLFEYHQLMMPFDDPTRISDELKWALTLYVLVNHGTLQQDARLDAGNAAGIALR